MYACQAVSAIVRKNIRAAAVVNCCRPDMNCAPGSGLVGFSAGAGAVGSLNTVPVTEFDQFGTFIVEFFHFLFLI